MRGGRGLSLLALAVGAVAAFLLLRGGDGGREVTHAELVAEVTTACRDLLTAGRALDPPFRPYGTESERYFAEFLARVEDAKRRLEDLEPSAEDEAAHRTLVDGYTAIETDLEEAQGAAAVDQDPEVVTRLEEIEATTARMVDAERALGACPGDASLAELPRVLRRTVPNPLDETGEF